MNEAQEALLRLVYANQLVMMDVSLSENPHPLLSDRPHILAQLVVHGRMSFEAALSRMARTPRAAEVLHDRVAELRATLGKPE